MSKKNRPRKGNVQPRPESKGLNVSQNWVIGIILAITFAAFFNTLFLGFAYDDNSQVLKNELIKDFRNIPTALTTEVWYFQVMQDHDPNKDEKPNTGYYRPIFIIYFMIIWSLFGTSAPGWHLASLLIHLIATYFAFLILQKFTKDLRLSAIGTLLFAIHPARSESVAWVSGVTDPLLAAFLLPSFYLYMIYREGGKRRHLVISLVLFLFAVFSKEPAVSIILFVGAYELFIANQEKPIKERLKPAAVYAIMFFAVSVIYFAMRHYALGYFLHDKKFINYPVSHVLLTVPLVIWKYLGLLLWPVNLTLFHGTPLVKTAASLRFILPFAGLILLGAALWRLRNSPVARFAILWFFIHLLPVLNLSAFPEDFMVHERYLYLPSLGFSLFVAMLLVKLPLEEWIPVSNRRIAQTALVAIICLLMGGKTLAQNNVWDNDTRLFAHGAEVAPDQPMALFILGHHYIKIQQPDKAVEALEKFVALQPDNLTAITNLAPAHLQVYEMTMDRTHIDRAIALCEKGLSINESVGLIWDTLGHAYTYETEIKNYDRARACFARSLLYQPENAMSNFHMGATYVKERDYENAVRYLEIARQQAPDLPDTYKFLGYAYSNRGQIKEAIDSLNQYLIKQPNAKDAAKERNHLETLRAKLQQTASQS